MPVICRYRPKRTRERVFSREDAARVVCYALEAVQPSKNITENVKLDGSNLNRQAGRSVGSITVRGRTAFFDRDLQDILARVERRCGAKSTRPKDLGQAAAAEAQKLIEEQGDLALVGGAIGSMEAAQEELTQNNVVWQSVLEWTLIVIGILTAFNRFARFIPFAPLRLVAAPLPLVIRRAAGFQGAILGRVAANDRNWVRLQRSIELLRAA